MCDEIQKRRHVDGDGNTEKIPELKKARYSWQVKGRCEQDTSGRCEQETSGHTSTSDTPSTLASSVSARVEELPCTVNTGLNDSLMTGRVFGSRDDSGNVSGASSSHGHGSKSDLFVNAVTIIKPSEGSQSLGNAVPNQNRLNALRCANSQSRNGNSAGIIGNASEHESSGRRGIHINFDTSSFQRPPVNFASYLWQKQEVGCAIVDNVFNKTLEEMGLSPDPKVNLLATTRLTVENRSIEAAIHQQGLVVQESQNTPPPPPPPPPRNSLSLGRHSFSKSVQGNELYNPNVTDNFFRHLLKDNSSKPKPHVSHNTLSSNSLINNGMSCQPLVSGVKTTETKGEDETNEDNSKPANAMCSFQEIETDNEMTDKCVFDSPISTENCSSKRSQMICESTSGAVDSGVGSGGCGETVPRPDVGNDVKVETDGGPDRVMDLAVSTALMSHGLTLSDSCDS